jgi:hypothetical protein
MRKITLLAFLSMGISYFGRAQLTHHTVIASDGGTAKTGNMSIDWTLGEPVVESEYTSNKFYTQGFHQPMLRAKELETEIKKKITPRSVDTDYEITVVPNPVNSMLTINISRLTDAEVAVFITDVTGQTIKTETIAPGASSKQIDVNQLSSGLYLLSFYGPDKALLSMFKISKL